MDEYEKINNEIKSLMNSVPKQIDCPLPEVKVEEGKVDKLIGILSDLIRVYKDIQFMLENNDNEGIKKKLLSDDIKISLVCESLMKVLKDECTEKKETLKLLEEEKNKNKSKDLENEELKHKLRKVESDLQYLSNGNKELNRIVQDQKTRVQSFKDRAELEIKGAESLKTINKELENLRQKALDKNEILVREINILKGRLEEKDQTIKKMKEEMKNKEIESKTNKDKLSLLEKNFISLRNKLETKEKSLDLCNSELANLISKNKRNENILEDLKSKSAYYERLYKAVNKQNDYLNEQLAKLINVDNASKIEISQEPIQIDQTIVTNNSDLKKLNGYKKRFKKYKKLYSGTQEEIERNKEELNDIKLSIERLKNENKRLQDEKEKAIDSNNQVTDTLLSKVENLLEKNKEYQKMIYDNQENTTQGNESFKTVVEETPIKKQSFKDFENMFTDIKLKNNYEISQKSTVENPLKLPDTSSLFYEDFRNRKYQRSFKLANEYETEKKEIYKSFYKPKENKIVEKNSTKESFNLKVPDSFYNKLVRKSPPVEFPIYNEFKLTDKESEEAEIKSIDSTKSLQTTSTLKEMIKKTETLQNKFNDLEKQLEEIKESDDPHPKKIHDQIKAYTDYYYSDYLDFSNEDNFL